MKRQKRNDLRNNKQKTSAKTNKSLEIEKKQPKAKSVKNVKSKKPVKPIKQNENDLFEQQDFDNDLAGKRGLRLIKGKKQVKKVQLLATVMAAVIILTSLAVLNTRDPLGIVEWTKNFTASIGGGDSFPQSSPNGAIIDTVAVDEGAAVLTDTALIKYKNNGKIIYNRPHHFKDPVLKISKTREMIYDLGGFSLSIHDDARMITEKKTDNEILSASISDNGYYCIVTKSKDYTCEVTVYDENGNKKYLWGLKDEYAVDTAVNDNGKSFAISTIKAADNKYTSTTYIYEMDKEEPISTNVYEDTLILDIFYASNDNLITVGDKLTSKTSEIGAERVDYSYDGKFLKDYSINEKNLTLLLSNYVDDGNEVAVLLDKNCAEVVKIVPDGMGKGICADDKNIFILYDSKLISYDFAGAKANEWDTGAEDFIITANDKYIYKASSVNIDAYK